MSTPQPSQSLEELRAEECRLEKLWNHCYPRPSETELQQIAKIPAELAAVRERIAELEKEAKLCVP